MLLHVCDCRVSPQGEHDVKAHKTKHPYTDTTSRAAYDYFCAKYDAGATLNAIQFFVEGLIKHVCGLHGLTAAIHHRVINFKVAPHCIVSITY